MFDAESDYEEETSSSSNEDDFQDGEQLWKASQWPGQPNGHPQSFITEAKNVKKGRLSFPRQCAMQVDFEMFLAASPPMFSPLMVGNLDSDFSPYHHTTSPLCSSSLSSLAANLGELNFKSVPSAALNGRRFPTPRSFTPATLRTSRSRPLSMSTPTAPLRSCLVVRPEAPAEEGASSDVSEGEMSPSVSPSRHKKRVVFADDKGLSLTEVKVMTEPSDCPPRWTAEFLEQVTRGASAEVAAERWELTFPQPASDYLNFRSRLETQNVALENLVVQEGDQQLVGTVKVKNLCFSKHVLVRATFDQWKSFHDVEASFVPSGLPTSSSSAAVNLFDTFSFKIAIPATPPTLNRIELCICFRSEAGEFWDNNQGKNYVLVKPDPPKLKTSPPTLRKSAAENRSLTAAASTDGKCIDAARVRLDSWTEFASWNHLVNDLPYW